MAKKEKPLTTERIYELKKKITCFIDGKYVCDNGSVLNEKDGSDLFMILDEALVLSVQKQQQEDAWQEWDEYLHPRLQSNLK
jgi:hypothetical protein